MKRRTPNPILAALALSAAAVLVYLGVIYFNRSPQSTTPNENDATSQLVAMLPDFSLENLDGVATPISSWPGKALIVNFWATWCAPCLREIPMLKAFTDEDADFQVVGIAIDRVDAVRQFAADMQFNYPVLVGADAMQAAGDFGISYIALPLTVFVAPDGTVIGAHIGELARADLEKLRADIQALNAGKLSAAALRAQYSQRM